MNRKKPPEDQPVLDFGQAYEDAQSKGGKIHLTLGNGFSIGAHNKFGYGTLYEQAKSIGLNKRIEKLFDHYGTCDFEEVLKKLDEILWALKLYEFKEPEKKKTIQGDFNKLKESLIKVISTVHPDFPSEVGEDKLKSCAQFLSQFFNVFTLNYDLLLYWSSASDAFPFEDGFGREEDTNEEYCVFLPTGSSKEHIYFLHGTLHLYTDDGEVRKRVWNSNIPLIDQVREALKNKQYPLVVSEGSHKDKLRRIEASSYLSYAWRKFENIHGNLFIYGHSLSKQDHHLLEAIYKNTALQNLYVGLHGNPSSSNNQELINRAVSLVQRREDVLASQRGGRRTKKLQMDLKFFRTETAQVWGE